MFDASESIDDLYKALADSDRRRLLFALLEHNSQEEVSIPGDLPVGDRDHELVHVEMVHRHLPLLEDMGFIEWDRQTHQVGKGPAFKTMQPALETLREYHEDDAANS